MRRFPLTRVLAALVTAASVSFTGVSVFAGPPSLFGNPLQPQAGDKANPQPKKTAVAVRAGDTAKAEKTRPFWKNPGIAQAPAKTGAAADKAFFFKAGGVNKPAPTKLTIVPIGLVPLAAPLKDAKNTKKLIPLNGSVLSPWSVGANSAGANKPTEKQGSSWGIYDKNGSGNSGIFPKGTGDSNTEPKRNGNDNGVAGVTSPRQEVPAAPGDPSRSSAPAAPDVKGDNGSSPQGNATNPPANAWTPQDVQSMVQMALDSLRGGAGANGGYIPPQGGQGCQACDALEPADADQSDAADQAEAGNTPAAVPANPAPAAALPSNPPAVSSKPAAIINPSETGVTLQFLVDGERKSLESGFRMELAASQPRIIEFDRGGSFGPVRYRLDDGLYTFTATEQGWGLSGAEYAAPEAVEAVRPEEQPKGLGVENRSNGAKRVIGRNRR